MDAQIPTALAPLFKPARYKFIRGGRGCVHPETLIETPSGPVRIMDFQGGEVYAFDGAGVVVCHAGPAVMFPVSEMLTVHASDGRSVVVTPKHRFLTLRGWVEAASLRVGDSISSPPLELQGHQLETCCAASLSESRQDARHCLRTLAGFLWSCFACHHLCDEQLLSEAKTSRDVARLLDGELRHSSHVWTHEDGPECEHTRSLSRTSRHLSSLAALLEEAAQGFEASGSCSAEISSGLLSASRRCALLSRVSTARSELVQGLAEVVLCLCTLSDREKSLQALFGELLLDVDDDSYSVHVGCSLDRHSITVDVVEVNTALDSNYCDLFVPFFNNYIAEGMVHHNSGKSWGVARALLIQAAQSPQRILCTREVQASIKDSVHALLKDQIQALKLGAFFEVLETEIRGRNGSRFAFRGLSDMTADSVKSFEGCTRVWLEEAQTITERSWRILTPTIRAPGSEIWATYNPQLDTDPTHIRAVVKAHPDTWSAVMNWRDNPWFPTELDAERLHAKDTMTDAEYLHVWEGQCMPAVEGAIYADEMAKVGAEHRITRCPADPMLKTHAVWDLGFADSMSIICAQRAASEIRIVDYIEDSRRALPSYVEQLKAMPYNWGHDWLPHDGFAVKHQTGKADAQVLRALGRQVQQTPGAEVEQGIRAARLVFPRVWFNDTPAVQRLVECLKRYRRNVSSRTGEPGTPRHDEFSHGADSFRYLCLVADRLTNDQGKKRTISIDELNGSWMGS